MPDQRLVSVVINNYNYGCFLPAAIKSVMDQTYDRIEIVVVDDGSTDDSVAILSGLSDRIVPVLKENGGQASAFNSGFAASRGEIIFFLDADDLFLPSKVERFVRIYNDNPDIGWCFDQVVEFESETGEKLPFNYPCRAGEWDVRALILAGTIPPIPTVTSGLSFRRDLLGRILPMPESIRITSDNYIKLVAPALERGWFFVEELTQQRIHGNNLYTKLKTGQARLGGQVAVLTAAAVLDHFPNLERAASKTLANGLGVVWATGGMPASLRAPFRSAWNKLSSAARLDVTARALYRAARVLPSTRGR